MKRRNFLQNVVLAAVVGIAFTSCSNSSNVQKLSFDQSYADQMIFRIAEIEVYPQYLEEYIKAANAVGTASIKKEPGVISLIPLQLKDDPTKIRIIEIYASQEAYQHHLTTDHFKTYKQGTLHMIKDLTLVDTKALNPAILPDILKN